MMDRFDGSRELLIFSLFLICLCAQALKLDHSGEFAVASFGALLAALRVGK